MITKSVLIFLGGGFGALGRFAVQEWTVRRWGGLFPFGTLAVNISGAFVMGFLMTFFLSRSMLTDDMRALFITGMLGGYTTFSALAWESIQLGTQNGWGLSFLYVTGSVMGGLMAIMAGIVLARTL